MLKLALKEPIFLGVQYLLGLCHHCGGYSRSWMEPPNQTGARGESDPWRSLLTLYFLGRQEATMTCCYLSNFFQMVCIHAALRTVVHIHSLSVWAFWKQSHSLGNHVLTWLESLVPIVQEAKLNFARIWLFNLRNTPVHDQINPTPFCVSCLTLSFYHLQPLRESCLISGSALTLVPCLPFSYILSFAFINHQWFPFFWM